MDRSGANRAMPVAPDAAGFTLEDRWTIAVWQDRLADSGVRFEVCAGLFGTLEDALVVSPRRARAPVWLIHKTRSGQAAVREWPGIAEIVPTIADALSIVAGAAGVDGRAPNETSEQRAR